MLPQFGPPSSRRFSYFCKRVKQSKYLYLLLFLPLVYFVIFKYVPMYGILIAFKDFKVKEGIWGSAWVGLEHFKEFLTDPNFFTIFKNTIILSLLQIAICFPFPIIFALFVNEMRCQPVKNLVERGKLLPALYFYGRGSFCADHFRQQGRPGQPDHRCPGRHRQILHAGSAWFRPLYIITDLWQETGWSAIIYLAALSGVDLQLYEACDIDGGGRFTKLWNITLRPLPRRSPSCSSCGWAALCRYPSTRSC